ncbi:MAG: GNAT family N-acetyltransferase [Nitrospirae bacterium]|uniref:GNAT family N-acetyltransferase n=1 Tax=Candidatus Magnetobacterium casense TaxID=1455061 RepID=UPI0006969880|nr:GNAT family N-acetyltransferase [Candidatus Magnetobacterium casensis]MBF0338599.1 GNAT family N-acetyltransferase [Nitrospirota bacterium]
MTRFREPQKQVKMFRTKKRHYTYPAVKIGRLGVHKDYQRIGVGRMVLDHIKKAFAYDNKTGCRFITVDAYNKPDVLSFYIKNEFMLFSENDKKDMTRLLYYDLIDIVPISTPAQSLE